MHERTARILALIRSFPCLEPKVRGWNPEVFDSDKFYAMMSGASHGEILCAHFVLNVWSEDDAKDKGRTFDLFEFAVTADAGNRRPVANWLAKPGWP